MVRNYRTIGTLAAKQKSAEETKMKTDKQWTKEHKKRFSEPMQRF